MLVGDGLLDNRFNFIRALRKTTKKATVFEESIPLTSTVMKRQRSTKEERAPL